MTERVAVSPHSGSTNLVTGGPSPNDGHRGERELMTFRRSPNTRDTHSLPRDWGHSVVVVRLRYCYLAPLVPRRLALYLLG